MKIALGFILVIVLGVVGSCAACATCTGGLAAIGTAYEEVSEEKRHKAARDDIHAFENALDIYMLRHGSYPPTDAGLNALYTDGILKGSLKKDPWGRDYVYLYPGKRRPNVPDVYSLGSDGNTLVVAD